MRYEYALGGGGSTLVLFDAENLTAEDVDDLSAVFAIMTKTLRRVIASRAAGKTTEDASEGGKVAAAPCGDARSKEMEEQTDLPGA